MPFRRHLSCVDECGTACPGLGSRSGVVDAFQKHGEELALEASTR
jgi:hypothetical protein